MKKSYNTTIIVLILFAILFISESYAQSFKKVDEIPLDISYYRTNRVSQPVVKVIYGRPTL